MKYIHIKNLDKFNPGYTDRKHIWAKIYWDIFLDENFQELSEIDRYRLISLIVAEVYRGKPMPLTPQNLTLMGWDTKKRSISLTLQMLHTFTSDGYDAPNPVLPRVEKNRVEKRESVFSPPSLRDIEKYIKEKNYTINAQTFYDYFTESGWVDSKGKKVKNWKQKVITWDSHTEKDPKEAKKEWI